MKKLFVCEGEIISAESVLEAQTLYANMSGLGNPIDLDCYELGFGNGDVISAVSIDEKGHTTDDYTFEELTKEKGSTGLFKEEPKGKKKSNNTVIIIPDASPDEIAKLLTDWSEEN